MNYFLIIIIGVIIFVAILYFLIFYDARKTKSIAERKRIRELQTQKKLKQIDSVYQAANKKLIYNHHFFSGKKVVITGDLNYFKTRNELAQLLWNGGAIVEKIFNSNIDVLIVGKSNIDSLKLKSAYYLNIKVIAEEELLSYFPDFKPFSKELVSKLQLN